MQQPTLPKSLGNIPCPTCLAVDYEPCIRGRAHSTVWLRKMLMPTPHDSRITANKSDMGVGYIVGFKCNEEDFESTDLSALQDHISHNPSHLIVSILQNKVDIPLPAKKAESAGVEMIHDLEGSILSVMGPRPTIIDNRIRPSNYGQKLGESE